MSGDPMFAMCASYLEANRQLNCSKIDDDAWTDGFCAEHMDPVRDRILANDCPSPSSQAGAVAALRLAEVTGAQGDYVMSVALIRAVMRFFDASEVAA